MLEDLGSKNGTSLDGEPVTQGVTLHDGNRIQVGPILIVYHASATGMSTETVVDSSVETTHQGLTRLDLRVLSPSLTRNECSVFQSCESLSGIPDRSARRRQSSDSPDNPRSTAALNQSVRNCADYRLGRRQVVAHERRRHARHAELSGKPLLVEYSLEIGAGLQCLSDELWCEANRPANLGRELPCRRCRGHP